MGSMRSNSTASANSTGKPKAFVCTWEGCQKSFTRSDHLQRHALNHSTGQSTCPRCSLHFKRPDLLARHLSRHKQKDLEAGGEGLGVVESRKRLWRDADGNIVSKRPNIPNRPSVGPEQVSNEQNHLLPSTENDFDLLQVQESSPPVSMMSVESGGQLPTEGNDNMNSVSGPDMLDFLANASWGSQIPQYSMPMQNDVPYDDIFNPDTASSFNMPFTTMSNYNWLFGREQIPTMPLEMGQQLYGSLTSDVMQSRTPQMASRTHMNGLNNSFENFRPNFIQDMNQFNGSSMQSFNTTFPQSNQNTSSNARSNRKRSSRRQVQETSSSNGSRLTDEGSSPGNSSGYGHTASSQTSVSEHLSVSPKPVTFTKPKPSNPPYVQSFRAKVAPERTPVIDDGSRNRILDFLSRVMPANSDINRDNPHLSLTTLQQYCDLFFVHFNVTYPLIHQATFNPSQVDTLLLLSVLLLGATYSDKAAHRLAVCIHEVLRAQIFQHSAFSPQPELWMLQTILLVECFGKSRAGQRQHDMAHLFHGLLVNLIRRSDCQSVRQPVFSDDDTSDLDATWRRAMDIEQRKRLAFLCFLWDTQHAVLFSQSLCISAFELRTVLPCDPASWEAESAQEWWMKARNETQTPFLSVLKAYMNPGSTPVPAQLNALSRLLILHGLMSIQWDLKRRDQTSMGYSGPMARDRQSWQAHLGQSYDAWKADFDTYCMNMTLFLNDKPALKGEFTRFTTATNAIYHAAHIILNIEILDLQIYAGARHIIGRPVARADFERSRRIVKEWAHPGISTPATKAAWHAAQLLRDGILNLDQWDVDNAFHYPWCLYLATLTCWAFHFAGSDNDGTSRNFDQTSPDSNINHSPDFVCDAKADMTALISAMTNVGSEELWRVAGKCSTTGLTQVMSRHLSNIRWAVIHEGMKVLRGLIANQPDTEYDGFLQDGQ